MKLINLVFQGIQDRQEAYDFGNKVVGCSMMQDADKATLGKALAFVLYGKVPADSNLPVTAELRLNAEDAEYTVSRTADKDADGNVAVTARVSGADDKTVADGEEAVAAFVAERVGLAADEFEKLFVISPDFVSPVAEDTVTRESFIAEKLAELATSDEVIARAEGLKQAEQAVYAEIDGIEPVTRDALKEQQIVVENDRIALESIRKEIDDVNNEIGLAEKYQEELTKYYEATAKMDALKAKEAEMSAMADKAAMSVAAADVASVFENYAATNAKLDKMAADLKKAEAERDALAKKIEDGKKSEAFVSNEYIEHARRSEELDKALRNIAVQGSQAPADVKITEIIERYYEPFAQEIKDLTAKRDELVAKRDALAKTCAEQTDRKNAIRETDVYKKAVEDAAVLAASLAADEAYVKEAQERIENAERARAAYLEENRTLVAEIKKGNAELAELGKTIRGPYATVEEAVNADALKKQRAYTKHLFVSSNEVELDAVNKKITAVEATKNTYAEKLAKLTARRDEVAAHRVRLSEKLKLLNEKMTEYMSQNRLRDMSSEIEYGSRCPICDGFVTYKKDLPLRDTKALDDQITAVEAEIKKDTDALLAAEAAVGQYKAAATVSAQYLESLIATRDDKKKAIDTVLAEYKAASVEDFFNHVAEIVENSNRLTRTIDLYREKDVELRKKGVDNSIKVQLIRDLDKNVLEKERVAVDAVLKRIAQSQKDQAFLAGIIGEEPADDLLRKKQVVDKEYYAIENELAEHEAELAGVEAELDGVVARLDALTARTVKVEVDGKELGYPEVVAKAYSDYILAVYNEIDQCEQVKENCKIRLLAIKKVVADAEEAHAAKNDEVLTLSATIDATRTTVSAIFKEYEARFAELGITSQSDIDRLVLDEETLASYRETLYKYDEDVAGLKEAINVYNTGITEHAGYYENHEKNVELLKTLQKEEERAVVTLGKSVMLHDEMEARYEHLLELNRKLTALQGRIEAIEGLGSAVQDGAIIASDLARVITERAQSIVKNMSKDRYAIDLSTSGAYVLRSTGRNKVRPDKLTKEESVLVPYATAFAYNEVMVELLAGDIVPEIDIDVAISDKASLAPIMEYAKSRDIIAIPEDETAFFRAVSKIAL